jgi:hypothetical protein
VTPAWGAGEHLQYLRPTMPAAEPHPRRRVAPWRALCLLLAATAVLLGPAASGAAGQVLPTSSTTAPATTTTEAEPVETTTTAVEAEPEPEATTTTTQATATTARPTTTARFDDEDEDDEVVTDEDVAEDAGTVADDEPAETTSTARDLLVSGDGTDGAQSTTTTSTTVVEVAADEDGALDEQAQIWLIVAGLVLVALLIGLWTWRYWVRTRPSPPDDGTDDTTVFRRG